VSPENLAKILSVLGSVNQKDNYKGILTNCPLSHKHKGGKDQHPSFFAYFSNAKKDGETSYGYCHACGFKGSISDLVQEISLASNVYMGSALHAIYLAEWGNEEIGIIDIPKYDDIPNHVRCIKDKKVIRSGRKMECSYFLFDNEEELPLLVNGEEYPVTTFDLERMCSQWVGRDFGYFKSRGLDDQDLIRWGLGHANQLMFRKFKKNKWYYLSFLSRAIFSIRNADNKIVGWSARRTSDNEKFNFDSYNGIESITTLGGPKYLHAQGFNKTQTLYGIEKADLFCDTAILVEGFFDVIRVDRSGYKNVFALMGGDLSKFQIEYLVSNFKKVVFFEDGDKAGIDIRQSAKSKLENKIEFVHVDSQKEGYFEKGTDPGDMDEKMIKSILKKYI